LNEKDGAGKLRSQISASMALEGRRGEGRGKPTTQAGPVRGVLEQIRSIIVPGRTRLEKRRVVKMGNLLREKTWEREGQLLGEPSPCQLGRKKVKGGGAEPPNGEDLTNCHDYHELKFKTATLESRRWEGANRRRYTHLDSEKQLISRPSIRTLPLCEVV